MRSHAQCGLQILDLSAVHAQLILTTAGVFRAGLEFTEQAMVETPTAPAPAAFNAEKYRQTTRAQWESAAEAWDRWAPLLQNWLGPATEAMLEMAHGEGVLARALQQAGLRDVEVRKIDSPVRLASAAGG